MSWPGGGGGMVGGGAHHDEDLPLVEEDLVPPLHLGLPEGCSRLNVEAVVGERATKVERWHTNFAPSDGGRTGGPVEMTVWAN